MDFKYIEQLLDRYFDCLTTLEEEQILRSFFRQENVPAHLMQYRDIFVYHDEAKAESLGEDFDARMLSLIAEKEVETPRIKTMRRHMAPFFRAAAIVAVIISIGNIAEHSISVPETQSSASPTAINPYIKSVDVESAIQIKDVSRAEATPQADTIPAIQPVIGEAAFEAGEKGSMGATN